jgi:hypothetical protein
MGFKFKAWKNGHWIDVHALGGLLTENAVMRMEVDIMIDGAILCERNGFPICLTVHDELLAEPLKGDADEKAFEQLMTEVSPWVKEMQIPIAVETWQGDRYRK